MKSAFEKIVAERQPPLEFLYHVAANNIVGDDVRIGRELRTRHAGDHAERIDCLRFVVADGKARLGHIAVRGDEDVEDGRNKCRQRDCRQNRDQHPRATLARAAMARLLLEPADDVDDLVFFFRRHAARLCPGDNQLAAGWQRSGRCLVCCGFCGKIALTRGFVHDHKPFPPPPGRT